MKGRAYKDSEVTNLRKIHKDLNIEKKYDAWLIEAFLMNGGIEHDRVYYKENGEEKIDYLVVNYEAVKIINRYRLLQKYSIKNIDIPPNWYKNLLDNTDGSDLIGIYSLAHILKSANIEGVEAMQDLKNIDIQVNKKFLPNIMEYSLEAITKAINRLIDKKVLSKKSSIFGYPKEIDTYKINAQVIRDITNTNPKSLYETDYLYLIQNSSNKSVKIGRSKNPAKRLVAVKRVEGNQNLILLNQIKGKGYIEKKVHEIFIRYHVKNEWFDDVQEIREFFQNFK